MPCQLFAQQCSDYQEITKISECSGSPKHSIIGNIHTDILLLGSIILQHAFKTVADGFNGSLTSFWWNGPLSEDRVNFQQIYQNYLVALKVQTQNIIYNEKKCEKSSCFLFFL